MARVIGLFATLVLAWAALTAGAWSAGGWLVGLVASSGATAAAAWARLGGLDPMRALAGLSRGLTAAPFSIGVVRASLEGSAGPHAGLVRLRVEAAGPSRAAASVTLARIPGAAPVRAEADALFVHVLDDRALSPERLAAAIERGAST